MGHAEADCTTLLERLYLYLDGEIVAGECAVIERHLELCAHCLKRVGFERELRLVIRRNCAEPPPAEVVERLRAHLRALRDAAGG